MTRLALAFCILLLSYAAAFAQSTTGNHHNLLVLVNFQDKPTQPYNVIQANAVMTEVDAYYREISYNQLSMVTDTFGWYTIPVSSTVCDLPAIRSNADAAAIAAGANLANYEHIIYAFPTNACSFQGNSGLGGNPSRSYVNGDDFFALGIVAHELGHGLGLYHSRSLNCQPNIIGACPFTDYGDVFDMMGGGDHPHFNLFQKERLGWLTVPQVTSGTYWLDPFETVGGLKGIKLLKSIEPSGELIWYYFEKRSSLGFDANLVPGAYGVLVHQGSSVSGREIYLLDMNPQTNSFYDASLQAGQSFSDPAAGISVTVLTVDGSGASLQVSVSCVERAPSVSVSPTETSWLAGDTAVFQLSVRNVSTGGCAQQVFVPNSGAPGFTVQVNSLTLEPGQAGIVNVSVTPQSLPDGLYDIGLAVGEWIGSVRYNLVRSIDIQTTGLASSYTRPTNVNAQSAFSVAGQVQAGVVVTYVLTKPNNSIVLSYTTTDPSGQASFFYRLEKRDKRGTYSLQTTAQKNGITSRVTQSFQVN